MKQQQTTAFLRLRSRRLNRQKSEDKRIKKTQSSSTSRASSKTASGTHSPAGSKPSSPTKDNLATLSARLVEALMRGPNRRVILRNRRLLHKMTATRV